MSDRDEALREFEAIVAGLIGRLEAGERSRLLRKMAHALRASQAKRMRAQRDPEGLSWVPRKTPRAHKANRPIRFLYKKPGAEQSRVADLKSWRRDGPHIVGYDREAGGLRTFLRARIIRHLPPEGSADPGAMESSLRGAKGQIRKKAKAMFVRMRTPRHLKAGGTPTSAWVDFTDRAARIARVSQFGLRDKVGKEGMEVRYPQRVLLGFSIEDREAMLSTVLEHVDV